MRRTCSIALLSFLISIAATLELRASTPSSQATLSPSELRKFKRPSYTPPEIVQIQAAGKKKDFKLAVQLEDALISRPDDSFQTKWAGRWIRSLALKARFEDRQVLGEAHKQVLGDLLQSARLGNLKAIRQAEDILEEYLFGMNRDEYPPLTDEDILII
jgi:hypothetical protein